MKLDVKLFGGLRCHNRALLCHDESEFVVNTPEGMTIRELLGILGLHLLPLLCIVNERQVREEYRLRDQDRVALFPPMCGG